MSSDRIAQQEVIRKSAPSIVADDEGFKTYLPYGCWSEAILEDENGVHIESLDVPKDLRKGGIGRRLIKATFKYCAMSDIEFVDSHIISPVAMRNRQRIFGDAILHFLQETPEGQIELPLTVEQACLSLERAENIWEATSPEEQDFMDSAILTRVYVADIDTTDWELPVLASSSRQF